jgi:hypothetical protein
MPYYTWKRIHSPDFDPYSVPENLFFSRIELDPDSDELPDGLFDTLNRNLPLLHGDLKCILRFVYATHAGGRDAPLDRVRKHVAALAPILHTYHRSIAVLQSGFFGAWGEWNRSTEGHDLPENVANRAALIGDLLDAFPGFVSLRTPMQVHELFPRHLHPRDLERIAIHNDCWLASTTDSGTYERPNIEYWKDYTADLALFGGEICNPNNSRLSRPDDVYREAKRLKLAYLNKWNTEQWLTLGMHDMVGDLMAANWPFSR